VTTEVHLESAPRYPEVADQPFSLSNELI
jgi:hypothetical protein